MGRKCKEVVIEILYVNFYVRCVLCIVYYNNSFVVMSDFCYVFNWVDCVKDIRYMRYCNNFCVVCDCFFDVF